MHGPGPRLPQPSPGHGPEKQTEMAVSEETVKSASRPERDDLTRITGIGPDIARRLDEVGISTYAELGASSASEIAKLLPDISPLLWGCIDAWRCEAQELASAASSHRDSGGQAAGNGNGQHYQSFIVRVLVNKDGSIRDTRMEHIGTGEVKRWAGWEHDAMLAFIKNAVADPVPLAAPTEPHDWTRRHTPPPATSRAAGKPVTSKRDIAAGNRPTADLAATAALRLDRIVLHASEPFTVTMTLNLTGAKVADRLAYSAVIVAKQLGGGPKLTLARATGLLATAGTPAIQAKAHGLPAGLYRLEGAVSLREAGARHPGRLAAAAEGIMLQVLPSVRPVSHAWPRSGPVRRPRSGS
jgi:predicted flap endonuclease-1-like 5' DNA nuclease